MTPRISAHNPCPLFTGFSFSGEVRQPFVSAIQALKNATIPIVSGDYQVAILAISQTQAHVSVLTYDRFDIYLW